jgi:transposase
LKYAEFPSSQNSFIMAKIVNSYAAGIDISSKEHVVAVPEEAGKVNVRTFQGFTEDLHQLAAWLKERKINTVAMESTGVYWYHLYTILLDQGFEVYLVNAYHVKNVPGRKSDVNDAQWLQQLHSFGLLRSCFSTRQPDAGFEKLCASKENDHPADVTADTTHAKGFGANEYKAEPCDSGPAW